ncbi:hypothetical protein AB0I28_19955 [Phytomonospora sp. NPDC050363]|uniref:hypothetical protein n=1 Tax=Phytomonospora sp. NPDC050363 TaxID=3155642 RepID=UPI0033CB0860
MSPASRAHILSPTTRTGSVAFAAAAVDACAFPVLRLPEVITVGSSYSSDEQESLGGACTDVFAPGSGLVSAWVTDDTATRTASRIGASAVAAGAAAMYLQGHPAASPSEISAALTSAAVPDRPRGYRLLNTRFMEAAPATGDFSMSVDRAAVTVERGSSVNSR